MNVIKAKNRRWKDVNKDSIELEVLVKHFELFNLTEGKSPKTVSWYNKSLKLFHRFLSSQKKSTILCDLDEAVVRQFILYLQSIDKWQDNPFVPPQHTKLAAITIQTYVRALRGFFNWLFKEGYTTENRLATLRPPKAPTKIVKVLTQEEIAVILACLNQNTNSGSRGSAIMLLLLDSGLRLSELTNAKFEDVNIQGGYVKVMGKGAKERIVPFGVSVQKALLRYVLHFRAESINPSTANLFLSVDGYPFTQNTLKMIVKRISVKSGVRRLHPHLCRHTFATNYLINGGDVFSLQQILGHTTLEMVRHYVTLASSQVTIQHRKFSPMDRLVRNKTGSSFIPKVVGESNRGSDSASYPGFQDLAKGSLTEKAGVVRVKQGNDTYALSRYPK